MSQLSSLGLRLALLFFLVLETRICGGFSRVYFYTYKLETSRDFGVFPWKVKVKLE
jgi:hypothetical protein